MANHGSLLQAFDIVRLDAILQAGHLGLGFAQVFVKDLYSFLVGELKLVLLEESGGLLEPPFKFLPRLEKLIQLLFKKFYLVTGMVWHAGVTYVLSTFYTVESYLLFRMSLADLM